MVYYKIKHFSHLETCFRLFNDTKNSYIGMENHSSLSEKHIPFSSRRQLKENYVPPLTLQKQATNYWNISIRKHEREEINTIAKQGKENISKTRVYEFPKDQRCYGQGDILQRGRSSGRVGEKAAGEAALFSQSSSGPQGCSQNTRQNSTQDSCLKSNVSNGC